PQRRTPDLDTAPLPAGHAPAAPTRWHPRGVSAPAASDATADCSSHWHGPDNNIRVIDRSTGKLTHELRLGTAHRELPKPPVGAFFQCAIQSCKSDDHVKRKFNPPPREVRR